MKNIEIRHIVTNEVIRTVEAKTLSGANLSGADLSGAKIKIIQKDELLKSLKSLPKNKGGAR